MNHIYRTIYNRVLGRSVVASERAKNSGTTSSTRKPKVNLYRVSQAQVTPLSPTQLAMALAVLLGVSSPSWAGVVCAGGVGNSAPAAIGGVACGINNNATGDHSVAMGDTNTASNDTSIALGNHNTISGQHATGVGDSSTAQVSTTAKTYTDTREKAIRQDISISSATTLTQAKSYSDQVGAESVT